MARRTKKEEEEAGTAQSQQVSDNDVVADTSSLSDQFKQSLSFFAPQIIGGLIGGAVSGDEGALVGMKTAGTFADSYRAHEQQQFENETQRMKLKTTGTSKQTNFILGNQIDIRTKQPVSYDPSRNEFRNTNGELIPGEHVRNRVDIGADKRETNTDRRFKTTGVRKDIKENRLQRGQDEGNRDDERNAAERLRKENELNRKTGVSENLALDKFTTQKEQFEESGDRKDQDIKLRTQKVQHQRDMFAHAQSKDSQVQGEYAEKFSGKVAMIQSLDVASILSKSDPITGQVTGRFKNFAEMFTDQQAFTKARVTLGQVMTAFIKDTSGTAVSSEERKVLETLMPRLQTHPAEFETTLKTVNEIITRNANTSIDARSAARPLERENLEKMRSLLPSRRGKQPLSEARKKKQARIKQLKEEIKAARNK